MNKDIFRYNMILKPFCERLTKHRHRKLIGWCRDLPLDKSNDYYYKCKICGYTFFNNNPRECDIEYIKGIWEDNKDEI